MRRTFLPALVASLSLAAPAMALGTHCDRQCLLGLLDATLASMAKHDVVGLPLAPRYRLTVDNVPSGLSMATPWRTITGYTKPDPGQYAIDTTQQEVAFLVLIQDGGMPATLAGRLKVEDRALSEIELYVGRSRSDSGMQFSPNDLAKLPLAWTAPIPPGARRASREALARFGMGDASVIHGSAEGCAMMENGHVVSDFVSLDAWSHMAPRSPTEVTEDIKRRNDAAHGGPIQFGCSPDPAVQADEQRRILVDEEQGIVVTFALVTGAVVPNFLPAPRPNPDYSTVFVPDFAKDDLAWRLETARHPPASAKGSYAEPMRAVLSVVLFVRIYDGKLQGLDRFMQAQPVGSSSPWYAHR